MFRNPCAAKLLGQRLLGTNPEIIAGRNGMSQWLMTGTTAQLQRRHSMEIRADFATGKVVMIDGWLLADTEARSCAMLAQMDESYDV